VCVWWVDEMDGGRALDPLAMVCLTTFLSYANASVRASHQTAVLAPDRHIA
jgi:hypothetical protein